MGNHQENRQDNKDNACAEPIKGERRENHRRTNECEGYAYIEMVGWMDRRERVRRNNDPSCF